MNATLIRHKILTIPGLDNSGPRHWQSLWEHKFPDCEQNRPGQLVGPRQGRVDTARSATRSPPRANRC
ncbi:alpha/beta hydrolase [Sphingopyxis sp. PET50]|uniref:alpha/beta hydrolase n=1 Tax=Sphingopyxis sp. PET50 TaxID=2976533 RepID=UPI00391C4461